MPRGGRCQPRVLCLASGLGVCSDSPQLRGKKPALAEGLHLQKIKNEKIILARTQGAPLPGWGAQVLFFHNPTQTSPRWCRAEFPVPVPPRGAPGDALPLLFPSSHSPRRSREPRRRSPSCRLPWARWASRRRSRRPRGACWPASTTWEPLGPAKVRGARASFPCTPHLGPGIRGGRRSGSRCGGVLLVCCTLEVLRRDARSGAAAQEIYLHALGWVMPCAAPGGQERICPLAACGQDGVCEASPPASSLGRSGVGGSLGSASGLCRWLTASPGVWQRGSFR